MTGPTSIEEENGDNLCDLITVAFRRAYPEVSAGSVEHMARNFTQVVSGVIDIGRRARDVAEAEVSHMDLANCLVYWCIANSHLEDFFPREGEPEAAGQISASEARLLLEEFSARIADWLVGIEALKDHPGLIESFVKGTRVMGTEDWERDRGRLSF
jgi:hypothetical protein